MQQTTNYKLNKIELSDSPADITVLNSNWDTIDTNLKKLSDEKFNKAGGTVSGTVTITGKLTENGGIDITSGNLTISNGSVSVNGLLTVGGLDISKQVDNSEIRVNGGNGLEHGGSLVVYGKDNTINKGGFLLQAHNGTNGATLTGSPDGALTWSGKLIASGGAELNGNVTFNNAMIGKTSFLSVVDVTKGTAPSAQKSFHWGFYDKNGFGIPANRLARIQYTIGTDNNPQMAMFVNRPNEGSTEDPVGIIAQWVGNTSARISVTHHPSTDSNDKQIATTYWVRNLRATTSQYGLVKVADETALLTESNDAALTVDKAYELNDFRRMNTAYVVGDKVNCAFNFGVYLECTTAGTTSAESLDTRSVTHGQVITDGTAQWTVRAHVKSVNGSVPDANGNVEVKTGLRESEIKTLVLNSFFPVGSIYMDATGNVNPNTQFGGTWVKIEEKFLLGSGTSKLIGTTGGEETVTLTTAELPEHYHDRGDMEIAGTFGGAGFPGWVGCTGAFSGSRGAYGLYAEGGAWTVNVNMQASRNWTGTGTAVGENQAHNNMPPYEVVNIWKRTA